MKFYTGTFILSIFLTISPSLIFGGTDNCTSLADGSFSTASNWSCGHVPDKDDNVTIAHNITLDVSFTGGNAVKGIWTINAGKKLSSSTVSLEISSTGDLIVNGDLDVNDITFKNGSTVNVSSASNVRVFGSMTNVNNSNDITINGIIQVDGNFSNNVNSVVSGTGQIRVTGNFTNDASGTVFGCTGTSCNCSHCVLQGSVMPVEFTQFTASLNENKTVQLKWTTATEINNDYFTVERSSNGLSFSELVKKKGAGNSSSDKNYEFTDVSPTKGISYYRIKQTDFDGKYDYSDVVAVSFEINSDGSCVFKVFPNPCPGKCHVALSDCKEVENSVIEVEILDALGNKIQQHLPYRNSNGSFDFYLDNSNALSPGIYIVRAISDKENYDKKVIVK